MSTTESTIPPPPARTREQHPDQAVMTAIARGKLPGADALAPDGSPTWTLASLAERWKVSVADLIAAMPEPPPDQSRGREGSYQIHR